MVERRQVSGGPTRRGDLHGNRRHGTPGIVHADNDSVQGGQVDSGGAYHPDSQQGDLRKAVRRTGLRGDGGGLPSP